MPKRGGLPERAKRRLLREERDKPKRSSSSSSSSATAAGLEDKLKELKLGNTVYLSAVRRDDSAQMIYAIDLPEIEVRPSAMERSKIQCFPVLEFPLEGDFPVGMSCMEWNSTLYFVGGRVAYNGMMLDSELMFFIEIGKINEYRKACEKDPYYLLRELIVQEGPPMNSPKSEELYAFVADERIFVISPFSVHYRFEVFDRIEGEEGFWSILPDPPFRCPVTFHMSCGMNILFGTFESGYYLFDLKKQNWFDCSRDLWPTLSDAAPISGGIKIGRLIYWNSLNLNVVCFGPTNDHFGENAAVGDFKNLFKDKGSYNELLWRYLNTFAPEKPLYTSLHYLGSMIFSYVIGGLETEELPAGKIPPKSNVRIILFEIPDSDLPSSSQEERKFTPKVLHVLELMCNGRGSCTVNGCITI